MAVDHVQRGAPFRTTVGLRQVALHDQTRALFHQSMTHAAEYRAGAGGFLVTARIGVGGRGMGGVGLFRALEIDFGIAVGVGAAGHRIGLGGGLGRCCLKRRIWVGRIARPFIIRRGRISLRLKAFRPKSVASHRATTVTAAAEQSKGVCGWVPGSQRQAPGGVPRWVRSETGRPSSLPPRRGRRAEFIAARDLRDLNWVLHAVNRPTYPNTQPAEGDTACCDDSQLIHKMCDFSEY